MARALWGIPGLLLLSMCSLREIDYLRDEACAPRCGLDASAVEAGAPDAVVEASAPECGADGGYRAQVACDRPVAYWRLGERGPPTARGEVDGGPPAAYVTPSDGGITYGVPGALAGDPDTAIRLDGTAWVSAGDSLAFPGNTPYSMEAWVAPEGDNFSYRRIIERSTTSGVGTIAEGYILYNQEKCVAERYRDRVASAVTGKALENLVYSHLVMTFDGGTLRLYVNGVLANTAVAATGLAETAAIFYIGGDGTGPGTGFIGSIDEVAIYPHVLAPERVERHYRVGRGP
jgi:hypothetical protein